MKNKEFTITDDLLATQVQRFLNFAIDLLFIYIIILSIGTTVILIAEAANNFTVSNWVESLSMAEITFYGAGIAFFYYYITEMYFSRTIAKLLTHTIVISADGTRPTKKSFFIRTMCRFIPFEAFSFFGLAPRGWHDAFSNTYVVKKRKLLKKRNKSYAFDEMAKV
jgi:uncharacterized RDD family membrane protein YckC